MDRQKDKISVEELKKYRSFVIGFALPAGDQAGFVSYFGVLRNERSIKLLDEVESQDALKLTEELKWLRVKFHFKGGSYRQGGDFIFGNSSECNRVLNQINHSDILYGQDDDRPFLLLLPEIWREREKGTIEISDESLLNLKLKAEDLRNPAAVRFGGSPPMQSLLYAFYGWKELIRQADKPPQQTVAASDYSCF